ncbi:Von willebrand factor type A domain protein [Oopsacas minuta]|uniref:von willebrand factor type A domain protein n=1 Tax=Oopsacas minuta TaxID=111878 RepID=A0AAV7KQZ4_9METZ|nr:Von willebrand factor type A domain protein [Oopsacas minuta]
MATKDAGEVKSKSSPMGSTVVSLEVSAHQQEGQQNLVMVSIKPGDCDDRAPCDICCVVDVSGSMGSEAKTKNDKGDVESHGLTLLDIVKHAVKTVVMCMEPKDRLSLVVYDSQPKKIFGLKKMDKSGKDFAIKKIDDLDPLASTNLWGGLEMGLDVMREESRKEANRSVFLLTDGLPNVIPPRGHIPMLKKYKDNHGLSCSIGTFGFGYQLDSQLLHDLAVEGNGMYAFIPDSSFVGTTFVNAMSNSLSTIARNIELSIETGKGTTIVTDENGEEIGGGHPCTPTTWGAKVSLGPLLFGQERNVLFHVRVPEEVTENMLNVTIEYTDYNGKSNKLNAELKLSQEVPASVMIQYLRTTFVNSTQQAIKQSATDLKTSQKTIQDLSREISTSEVKSDKFVGDLLKDVTEQTTEALSRSDWCNKWGVHYLLSLKRAHLMQQCTNFKDPGLQHYGGNLFEKLRDSADEIFIKIPPPKPKMVPTTAVSAPLTSMSRYHNRGAPCFSGDSLVLLHDDSLKLVSQLIKGDIIKTPTSTGKIACVVKTHCSDGKTSLVGLNGLKITPWHPVRVDGMWHYPCELSEPVETDCDAVYSFMLESSDEEIIIVNGLECATLGHRYTGDVIGHPYFGSNKVRDDLTRMRGWENGCVELSDRNCLVKDMTTGLVTSLFQ